ncbi:MAG: 30S ribosomal protein S12 methylthiotransferase RimO [Bacillota bacterium]|nr:30S ribosomal protein S12 methylthiotransferase RimO [Bacillota bacterium]
MKIYIETLGCPKNFNDSEGIGGICEKADMTITDNPYDADAIIVNTCGFINDAKTESIDTIFSMAGLIDERMSENPAAEKPLLIVSGCLSERYAEELAGEMPEVDIFMGVNDYERLPEIISEKKKIYHSPAPACFEEFSARKLESNPYTATLRIAEGCNNCCAYCVIPQIRGGYRSRPMENILEEAKLLAEAGTRELILIAQDVTEYGRDLYDRLMLPELLRKLCTIGGDDLNRGFRWIRLMYCYEDKITDELIEVMASEERICHYIDIPLQHISDNVLRGMRRRSTSERIKDTITRLREAMPDIHIRTTFITGFPDESEEDFDQLYDFAEEFRFERLGVFAYSQEEGTPAGDREDQVSEETRAVRADSIMRMQVDISREVNNDKVGSVLDVLVDGIDEDGAYIGRTMYDAPEIDNTVIFNSDNNLKPGDFVKVQILDAFDYDLAGIEAR